MAADRCPVHQPRCCHRNRLTVAMEVAVDEFVVATRVPAIHVAVAACRGVRIGIAFSFKTGFDPRKCISFTARHTSSNGSLNWFLSVYMKDTFEHCEFMHFDDFLI